MNSNEIKTEMWTANCTSEVNGELSFGNISSRIYPSAESAWNECRKNMESMKKIHTDCDRSFVNDRNYYAELWNSAHTTRFAWSVQKMVKFNSSKND